MNTLLKEINEYTKNNELLKNINRLTINLAMKIAIYAHKNQFRANGDNYFNHPYNVYKNYRLFLGLNHENKINIELLEKYNIPYYGVEEICLLHDVIEDTNLNINDLKLLFKEIGYEDYFIKYIKTPLLLITKDDSKTKDEYYNILITNPVSAIVKMCDFYDNLNPMTLDKFDKKTINRSKFYFEHMLKINEIYHFIEAINQYKKELF